MDKDYCLLFEHTPKAAGTSLTQILRKYYSENEYYPIYGSNSRLLIEDYKKYTTNRKNEIKLIFGHFVYQLLPFVEGNVRCFTILRNPIDRIVSHYYYVLRSPSHYLYEKVKNKMDLEDYALSDLNPELSNDNTQRFSGYSPQKLLANQQDGINVAINALTNKFFIVGITELFNETVLLLYKDLSWSYPPFYRKMNVTDGRMRVNELSHSTINAIKEKNSLDLILYNHFLKHFKQNIQSRGVWFRLAVRWFTKANNLFQKSGKLHLRVANGLFLFAKPLLSISKT